MFACAAFFSESRIRFVERTEPYRKSGGMGHPGIGCTFCRGQEMPRFMPRGSETPVDDFKESRMEFDNATNFDRKAGGSPISANLFRVFFVKAPTKSSS